MQDDSAPPAPAKEVVASEDANQQPSLEQVTGGK